MRAATVSGHRQYVFDFHRLHLLNEVMCEDVITIAQQIARHAVRRKCPAAGAQSIRQLDVL